MACTPAHARLVQEVERCYPLLLRLAQRMERRGELVGVFPPEMPNAAEQAVGEFMAYAECEEEELRFPGEQLNFAQRAFCHAELWESHCRATLVVEFKAWVELAIEEGCLW